MSLGDTLSGGLVLLTRLKGRFNLLALFFSDGTGVSSDGGFSNHISIVYDIFRAHQSVASQYYRVNNLTLTISFRFYNQPIPVF